MMKAKKSFESANADFIVEYNNFTQSNLLSKVLKRLMNKWRNELEKFGVFFENHRSGQVRLLKI